MKIGNKVMWLYKEGIIKAMNNDMISVSFIIDDEEYLSNIHKNELTII